MTRDLPLVVIVDDDESVRESLPDLLREHGFAVQVYESGEDFLASADLDRAACLLLDVAMPGMSGPAVLDELERRGKRTPVVFISAHGNGTDRPALARERRVDCLLKPFSEKALLAALERALEAG